MYSFYMPILEQQIIWNFKSIKFKDFIVMIVDMQWTTIYIC